MQHKTKVFIGIICGVAILASFYLGNSFYDKMHPTYQKLQTEVDLGLSENVRKHIPPETLKKWEKQRQDLNDAIQQLQAEQERRQRERIPRMVKKFTRLALNGFKYDLTYYLEGETFEDLTETEKTLRVWQDLFDYKNAAQILGEELCTVEKLHPIGRELLKRLKSLRKSGQGFGWIGRRLSAENCRRFDANLGLRLQRLGLLYALGNFEEKHVDERRKTVPDDPNLIVLKHYFNTHGSMNFDQKMALADWLKNGRIVFTQNGKIEESDRSENSITEPDFHASANVAILAARNTESLDQVIAAYQFLASQNFRSNADAIEHDEVFPASDKWRTVWREIEKRAKADNKDALEFLYCLDLSREMEKSGNPISLVRKIISMQAVDIRVPEWILDYVDKNVLEFLQEEAQTMTDEEGLRYPNYPSGIRKDYCAFGQFKDS